MKRPEPTEYGEHYAGYISQVPGSDVLSVLESQRLQMLHLFAGRSERDGTFRYAPGAGTWGSCRGVCCRAQREHRAVSLL